MNVKICNIFNVFIFNFFEILFNYVETYMRVFYLFKRLI